MSDVWSVHSLNSLTAKSVPVEAKLILFGRYMSVST